MVNSCSTVVNELTDVRVVPNDVFNAKWNAFSPALTCTCTVGDNSEDRNVNRMSSPCGDQLRMSKPALLAAMINVLTCPVVNFVTLMLSLYTAIRCFTLPQCGLNSVGLPIFSARDDRLKGGYQRPPSCFTLRSARSYNHRAARNFDLARHSSNNVMRLTSSTSFGPNDVSVTSFGAISWSTLTS